MFLSSFILFKRFFGPFYDIELIDPLLHLDRLIIIRLDGILMNDLNTFTSMLGPDALHFILKRSNLLTFLLKLKLLFLALVPLVLLHTELLLKSVQMNLPGWQLFHLLDQELTEFAPFDVRHILNLVHLTSIFCLVQ